MPAACHFDAPTAGGPLSGAHPGLLRPPLSSSASSSFYLEKSTTALDSESTTPGANVKRKRHRDTESTPVTNWTTWNDGYFSAESIARNRPDVERMKSGGERRYVLAGQIETPGGVTERRLGELDESYYSDIDYRRRHGSRKSQENADLSRPTLLAADRAVEASIRRGDGWGVFAFNTIGGVVGKVWQFCTASAFRGFHAGEGRGYDVQGTGGALPSPQNGQVWGNEHDVPTPSDYGSQPLPGGFPESDYSPYCYERETPEWTPPPAAKRRQVNEGANDELRRNWVLVNEPADKKQQQSQPQSPLSTGVQPQRPAAPPLTRRISKPVSRLNKPTLARNESYRISHAGSPTLSTREPASFASPRSPTVSQTHTLSKIPVPSRPQSATSTRSPGRLTPQPSKIPSPSPYAKSQGHRRTRSLASAASTMAPSKLMKKRESVHESSPRLDAEAKRLAARRAKEELETDLRINDFNTRLKDMIRQGQEALGSTIEVELDEDEGDVDPWLDE